MEGLWARLRRGRAKSLSATTTTTPTTLPITTPGSQTQLQQQQREAVMVERRIHPDLDALVADWEPPPRQAPNSVDDDDDAESGGRFDAFSPPPPLRPSARRHTVDGAVPVITSTSPTLENLDVASPTRAQRIMTRLKGSATTSTTPVTATTTETGEVASTSANTGLLGWSTFGRGSRSKSTRPHLSEFGEQRSRDESPVPSQASTSYGYATPSTMSQQQDREDFSQSGHGHSHPSERAAPSPGSGFTFGSRAAPSKAPSSTPPPMPALDHPIFGVRSGTGSPVSASPSSWWNNNNGRERFRRGSASLPSMHTGRKMKRFRTDQAMAKAQDIFAAFTRPNSRRASESGGSGSGSGHGGVALDSSTRTEDTARIVASRHDEDAAIKFSDARAKRVAGSSDTQTAVWPDVPPATIHIPESSDSTTDTLPLMPAGAIQTKNNGSPDTIRSTRSVNFEDGGSAAKGKRRAADVVEGTPSRTSDRPSNTSPPSAHRPKPARSQSQSRSPSQPPSRQPSQPPSQPHSRNNTISSRSGNSPGHQLARSPSRISQAPSLPISALVTPHAPSVVSAGAGSYYQMRDPRKPPRVQPTGWAFTSFSTGELRDQKHALMFFFGFVLFPLWWIAGVLIGVPKTRRLEAGDAEKGTKRQQVVLDDPQVEFDARTWRKRCRIMAGVSLFTYVPFIVLLVVFLKRK
ncbi:hypothetical protein MIND_00200600 [Mycena indigotica]|uniref:Uncharacterized protein n=1 Tax=Mycena indigotica TaxID=2126181 RepID=A0A8H6T6P0_9AGAR|nr:uncharacterized protein MIND_00200600 [Mycena indigotica]KAF7311895.1 hypothetical protein MIND_00200600 [Mycena indigotica]